ncbi:MAG: aminopeptidase P family protein [Corallococcus sp.]|nr:aminopeptidase P family protein [Corallococcus sp.]
MKEYKKLFDLEKIDAALILSSKNRFYFTEFASTFGFLLLFPQKSVFITDSRYLEMAETLKNDGIEVKGISAAVDAYSIVKEQLAEAGAKKVGFEDSELTVHEFGMLQEKLSDSTFIPIGKAIAQIRSIKTLSEIEYVKKAQTITDAAFTQMLTFIKEGMSEIDISVELEYRMRKLGASGLAFDTIVASGENTSKPHAHPTNKKIEKGDAVLMDFGAAYNGYCSDMTRTVFVGEPVAEMRNIYNIVQLAQKTAINNAYCGMTGKELDMLAREVIVANGYGEYFLHSTGHSLGIDIHEEPRAAVSSTDALNDSQFITVEPGIYLAGVGGVRIEDLLLITKDGVIDLTTSEKNIIIL